MMAFTHIAVGAATGMILANALGVASRQETWLLAGAVVGSLLPDIDHPKSWLGRRIPFISIPLSSLVGHRGVTHSLIGLNIVFASVLLSAWLGNMSGSAWAPAITGLGIGYASHLLADWLSNTGIPLLWPSRQRFAAPITIQTGSPIEYLIALGLYAWLGTGIIKGLGHA